MLGIADRSDKDKDIVRGSLLTGLAGGVLGFLICVAVLIVGICYGVLPLHPILHKIAIALGVFAVSFLLVLGVVLSWAYWY